MTRDSAIAIAKEALERDGFLIEARPGQAFLVSAAEINQHATAFQARGPRWCISFPLKRPNELRSEAGIWVDDTTGETSGGSSS